LEGNPIDTKSERNKKILDELQKQGVTVQY
jgi:hypothetical protein